MVQYWCNWICARLTVKPDLFLFLYLSIVVPVTDRWRDELRTITEQAGLGLPNEIKEAQAEQPKRTSVYSAETGRLIPPPSRAMSRGVSRQKQRDHDLMYHIAIDGSNESLVSRRFITHSTFLWCKQGPISCSLLTIPLHSTWNGREIISHSLLLSFTKMMANITFLF